MVHEQKTVFRIYDSNGSLGYEELMEGLNYSECLKIIGLMELAKVNILEHLNKSMDEEK